MKRVHLPFKTWCIAVASCCALCGTAGERATFEFVPSPGADGAALLSGSTWVASGADFTLRVQRIDEQGRKAYIERFTGAATDPFVSPPGQPPGFVNFVMQLENNGGGEIVFRAQQCWLVTDKAETLYPIGGEGLRARYGMVGREMGPAYERAVSALVPTTRSLRSGESMAGLLVYRKFKPKTKRYQLDIQITTSNGDVATVSAPYRRVKKNRGDEP